MIMIQKRDPKVSPSSWSLAEDCTVWYRLSWVHIRLPNWFGGWYMKRYWNMDPDKLRQAYPTTHLQMSPTYITIDDRAFRDGSGNTQSRNYD